MRMVQASISLVGLLCSLSAFAGPDADPYRVYARWPGEIQVTNAAPGEFVKLYGSRSGTGAGPCVGSGFCLGILSPDTMAQGNADSNGEILFITEPMPANASNDELAWQAVGDQSGAGTVVVTPLLPATDTDEDGLPDFLEPDHGTDPNNADSDFDGLYDNAELELGTDPLNPDFDSDNRPDGYDPWPFLSGPGGVNVNDDTAVSKRNGNLPDPEWSPGANWFTWQEGDGSDLWVAQVDPTDGSLVPRDGRGILVDNDVAPIPVSRNGPEWYVLDGEPHVIYGRNDDGLMSIWHAWRDGLGFEIEKIEGSEGGFYPGGTQFTDGTDGFVKWDKNTQNDVRYTVYGSSVDPATRFTIPQNLVEFRFYGQEMMGTVYHDTGTQLMWFDSVGESSVLRSSSDTITGPYKTRSPVTEEPLLVYGTAYDRVEGTTEIGVYSWVTGSGWTLARTISPPPALPIIHSPEGFEVDGDPWVLFTANQYNPSGTCAPQEPCPTVSDEWPMAQVWIASIDPNRPQLMRRLCGGTPGPRRDPEIYLNGVRPWAYYTEKTDDDRRVIHRCDMGF